MAEVIKKPIAKAPEVEVPEVKEIPEFVDVINATLRTVHLESGKLAACESGVATRAEYQNLKGIIELDD